MCPEVEGVWKLRGLQVSFAVVVLLMILGLTFVVWPGRVGAGFPTKAGSYTSEGWRYDYVVLAAGTRSERRTGRLYDGGVEITAALGAIRETPVGRFAFFGLDSQRYNVGWLNTLTHDEPVFGPDGRVLPEVQGYFSNPDSQVEGNAITETVVRTISTDHWSVRVTEQYYGSPMQRAQPFITRYYRKQLPDGEEHLAYQMNGTYAKGVLRPFLDGTLLLSAYDAVTWVPVNAFARDERLRLGQDKATMLQAWDDGALVTPYLTNREEDLFFVPIANGRFRWDQIRKLTMQPEAKARLYPGEIERTNDRIIWCVTSTRNRNVTGTNVCVFDLGIDALSTTSIPGRESNPSLACDIVWFDGTIADVRTANGLAVVNTRASEVRGYSCFQKPLVVRDGFRHYLFHSRVDCGKTECDQYRIVAVDVEFPEREPHLLRELPPSVNPDPAIAPNGIEIWDGDSRVVLPWPRRDGNP